MDLRQAQTLLGFAGFSKRNCTRPQRWPRTSSSRSFRCSVSNGETRLKALATFSSSSCARTPAKGSEEPSASNPFGLAP
eukprot:scaffold1435_cov267-Pinguiococcus_pyrenoidosus.AAC.27